MDWIIHLGTDELLYPGEAAEYSVRHLLADVPDDVDMVIFPNYQINARKRKFQKKNPRKREADERILDLSYLEQVS